MEKDTKKKYKAESRLFLLEKLNSREDIKYLMTATDKSSDLTEHTAKPTVS